jgi:hypothetical protein
MTECNFGAMHNLQGRQRIGLRGSYVRGIRLGGPLRPTATRKMLIGDLLERVSAMAAGAIDMLQRWQHDRITTTTCAESSDSLVVTHENSVYWWIQQLQFESLGLAVCHTRLHT